MMDPRSSEALRIAADVLEHWRGVLVIEREYDNNVSLARRLADALEPDDPATDDGPEVDPETGWVLFDDDGPEHPRGCVVAWWDTDDGEVYADGSLNAVGTALTLRDAAILAAAHGVPLTGRLRENPTVPGWRVREDGPLPTGPGVWSTMRGVDRVVDRVKFHEDNCGASAGWLPDVTAVYYHGPIGPDYEPALDLVQP